LGRFSGKTYTPLKAAQSPRAAHPSAYAGCFNFRDMGWAHSPRAAHPFRARGCFNFRAMGWARSPIFKANVCFFFLFLFFFFLIFFV
jgi:hypothetical protein